MKSWMKKSTIETSNDNFGLFGNLKPKQDNNEEKSNKKKGKFGSISLVIDGKKYDKKLEMEAFSLSYEKYLKQEENLSGVLNTKTLNLKNLELREKIHYWRESKDYRELNEDKIKDKERELFGVINKYCTEMSVDKELLVACQKDYFDIIEEKYKIMNEENTLNDFLLELDEFKTLEVRDIVK